jgi:hypothetical protein
MRVSYLVWPLVGQKTFTQKGSPISGRKEWYTDRLEESEGTLESEPFGEVPFRHSCPWRTKPKNTLDSLHQIFLFIPILLVY